MKNKVLTEGLDYHDLEGMILPIVSVDEYSAKLGKDSEIITMAFIIKSRNAGNDLADWFERGYDWVLDAEVSEGELSPGRYLVFVEMSRRTTAPERIVELLSDLETITNIPINEWVIRLDDEDYEASEDILSQVLELSPHSYREADDAKEAEQEDSAINEMKLAAGLDVKKPYKSDEAIKAFVAMAGL